MKNSISNYLALLLFCATLSVLLASCRNTNQPADNADDEVSEAEWFTLSEETVNFPLEKGPYQFNGASPWYSLWPLGSNNQYLKLGLDTGNNANWVTSTQCNTAACTQPGRVRFDFSASTSFAWVDTTVQTLKFGPWGNMKVNTGSDYFGITHPFKTPTTTMLSVNYDSTSFAELDWDGGIGFPSQQPDQRTTWVLEQIVNAGLVSPQNVCLSFYNNPATGIGNLLIGDYDTSIVDEASKLIFPFKPYTGLAYLWSTPFDSWSVAGQTVSIPSDTIFVFDTGASDFKGDTIATNAAIRTIKQYYQQYGSYPTMDLYLGADQAGAPGHLVLTSEQFIQEIEAGPSKGTEVIAIDTLDIPGMILVGSILLEDIYPVFWYDVSGSPGNYELSPREAWLFNKKDGPRIIQNQVPD